MIRRKGPSRKFLVSKGRRNGKQFQNLNTCICSRVSLLTGLLDYRYGIIVFREVRSGEPILTPGEAYKNELRNAKQKGRPGDGSPRLLSGRPLPQMANPSAPGRNQGRCVRLFIDASGSIGESDFNGGDAERPKTKKKGGAITAPPLKGSDTSVSSPKRQTAEAVRI